MNNAVDRPSPSPYFASMSILDILKYPAPILKRKAQPVETVDAETRRFIDDMFQTMYAAPGIGLAAPQVGVSRRILVLDPARNDEPKQPLAMINPEILRFGEERRVHEEGCLSLPEIYAEIERPASVSVRYVDGEGHLREGEFDGIVATIIQHEVDHLDGILFVDHLSRLKRDLLIRKFHKARRDSQAAV